MTVRNRVPAKANPYAGPGVHHAGFTIGAEGSNIINVGIQLKGANYEDIAARAMVFAYLSDDANGDSITALAPNTGVAIGTDGLLVPSGALTNGLLVHGTLTIDAVAEKFKTTTVAVYTIGGGFFTKAATTALVFSASHVITASKFGVILIQINAAGTVSTKVPASPQAYNSAPLALAALPTPDAGNVALGYIAIENNAGDWTANTDDLTDASDVTTAAFTNTTVQNNQAKAFMLTSESDGDIDINITETGVKTWYLNVVMPDGTIETSGAITFA